MADPVAGPARAAGLLTRAAVSGLSLLLAGCVSLPPLRSASCETAKRPEISISDDGLTASVRLDVLTYNVEGLPNSLRGGRPPKLREIGRILADLRRRGEAPDVVMFQEVFSRSAREAVLATGYPTMSSGPSARHRPPPSKGPGLPGRKNPRKGELSLKLASSGLVIATEFPLIASGAQPFGRSSCAGFDCLSNKGLALARVAIPGLPAPLDLYTTHMNAMRASRVKEARHFAAHARQAREIGEYLEAQTPSWLPVIFGGDFNMRAAPARFETFEAVHGLELVHVRCLATPDLCDVRMSWDGDAPWLDTQDLQLFGSGTGISVRPVQVEAMFDGSPGSPRLSDHDGLHVVYELSWPAAASPPEPCSALRGGRNRLAS
jgi:endonuclease/exonuclease/phosphatase family metal-dependent hydrolase